jgi:hypothetical protein
MGRPKTFFGGRLPTDKKASQGSQYGTTGSDRGVHVFVGYAAPEHNAEVKSLFLCECLTREHRAPVVHAAAA